MDFIETFHQTIANLDGFQPNLYAGASEAELTAMEEAIQMDLPEDFKRFYRCYNGQDPYADRLFDIFSLDPICRILDNWNSLKDIEDFLCETPAQSDPEVQNRWYSSKWIPFASTADGHHLCIDLAPTSVGTMGQIITFWYNESERELAASSFQALLEQYVQRILDGAYVFQCDEAEIITLVSIARADGKPMFGME